MGQGTSLLGGLFTLDYRSGDFEAFREDAIGLISEFTPEWTDRSAGDVGISLLELFAVFADVLDYHGARVANECFLPFAQQRRSVVALNRLIAYELRPATSAIVEITLTTDAAGTILAGSQVSTESDDAVSGTFELIAGLTVAAAGTLTADFIEGTSTSEILGSGNSTPGQTFVLARSPLSYDPSGVSSLLAYVDEGAGPVQYTEVRDFRASLPTDRHFRAEIDDDDEVSVIFGDGVRARVVAFGTSNVTASYRIGGGSAGNKVGIGKLTRLASMPAFVTAATNAASPQGGQEKETIEEARVNGPLSLRALDRAVTLEDYETLAEQVGGIAQARAFRGTGPYEAIVYVAAAGSNPVASGTWDPRTESGTGLVGQVGSYLVPRKAAPYRLVVRPPDPVQVTASLSIEVLPGYFQATVEAAALQVFADILEVYHMGEAVELSDVMGAMEDVPGLKKVRFTRFARVSAAILTNPDPFYYGGTPDTTWTITSKIASSLGEYALSATDLPTVEETLLVRFLTASTYRVESSVFGAQSVIGSVGAEWPHDRGNVTLLATVGAIASYAGNQYRIGVGSGVIQSSIALGSHEKAVYSSGDVAVTTSGGIAG